MKELGADFKEITLSREYHRKIARKMVQIWETTKNRTIINFACAPCKLVNREIYRIAAKHGIPTIIYGTNIYEAVQIAPGVSKSNPLIRVGSHFYSAKRKASQAINLLSIGLKIIVRYPHLIRYFFLGLNRLSCISPLTRVPCVTISKHKDFRLFLRWAME